MKQLASSGNNSLSICALEAYDSRRW